MFLLLVVLVASSAPEAAKDHVESILKDGSIQQEIPKGNVLGDLEELTEKYSKKAASGGGGSYDKEKIRRLVEKLRSGKANAEDEEELKKELEKAGLQKDEVRRLIEQNRYTRERKRNVRQREGNSMAGGALWMIIIVIAALGAVWLFTALGGYHRDATVDPDEPEGPAPDLNVIAAPLADADTLAQRGDFSQAAHALLLRTLRELSAKLEAPLPPALTSREVLGEVAIPDQARAALGGIVDLVEISHFGDAPIGQAEYQQCLGHFDRFASAYLRGR